MATINLGRCAASEGATDDLCLALHCYRQQTSQNVSDPPMTGMDDRSRSNLRVFCVICGYGLSVSLRATWGRRWGRRRGCRPGVWRRGFVGRCRRVGFGQRLDAEGDICEELDEGAAGAEGEDLPKVGSSVAPSITSTPPAIIGCT